MGRLEPSKAEVIEGVVFPHSLKPPSDFPWGPDVFLCVGKLYHIMDKISELPEPLLHHILSFLHIKQVVQSSTLSSSII